MNQYKKIVREAVEAAYKPIEDVKRGRTDLSVGQKDHGETVTNVDIEISEVLQDYCRNAKEAIVLHSEESGESGSDGEYALVVDENDGTDNLVLGNGELPHGPMIALYDSSNPCFNNWLGACFLEATSGNLYEAYRHETGAFVERAGQTV